MVNERMELCRIELGQHATVRELKNESSMRRRLCDIGLIEGTVVECVGQSPSGDPKAYLIRGAVIAIRNQDGKHILVEPKKEAMKWD